MIATVLILALLAGALVVSTMRGAVRHALPRRRGLAQLVVPEPRPTGVLDLDPANDHEQDRFPTEDPPHRTAPVGDTAVAARAG